MASETRVQEFVHKLEEGGWATWIRRALLLMAIVYVINLWMFKEAGFRGLSHEIGIEQSQIAREIGRGNGFSTKMIRPAALWQFRSNTGSFPLEITPDTYHAPLTPAVHAVAFKVADGLNSFWKWSGRKLAESNVGALEAASAFPLRFVFEDEMSTKVVIYPYDKIVASVQLVFFLLGVLMSYLTAKRLFDKRLALLGMGLLLLCQPMWDFALSGLPQMLLLFLFSVTAYLLVRAIEARYAGRPTLWWSVGIGAAFGVLALAHAITIFAFGGALLFAVLFFRPRARDAAIMLGVFALFYGPWMVRNQQVCGNPLGLGWYSGLAQVRGSETQVMRTMALEGPLKGVSPTVFLEKMRQQTMQQFSGLYSHLGALLVAPVFFIALLHLFKRPEAAMFRWCLLSMWLFAVFGMAAFGLSGGGSGLIVASQLQANDIHIIFAPLMAFYGMAFIMMLWSRIDLNIRLIRIAFIVLIFAISALPFLSQFIELHQKPRMRVNWPPYVPPFIAELTGWTTPKEIIAADIPWAVAWYADRKSLWLPMTREDFIELNDYNSLGGRMVGLYLTPYTGNRAMLAEIVKGEFAAWAPFILRQVDVRELQDFPLRARIARPIDNECIFYSDRDRWSMRED